MPKTLSGSVVISDGATETVYVDLSDFLRSGETLTGTPTVTEVDTDNLTLENKALISSSLTVPTLGNCFGCYQGDAISANKGVIFSLTPSEAGTYTVKVQSSTTGVTPTQVIIVYADVVIK